MTLTRRDRYRLSRGILLGIEYKVLITDSRYKDALYDGYVDGRSYTEMIFKFYEEHTGTGAVLTFSSGTLEASYHGVHSYRAAISAIEEDLYHVADELIKDVRK